MTRPQSARRAPPPPKEASIGRWMPTDIREFHSEIALLTLEQIGALSCLKVTYWTNGPLPNDEKILANIARISVKKWRRDFAPALMRFFTIGDDGNLHHARLDVELERARGIGEKRREAANSRHGNSGQEEPQEAELPPIEPPAAPQKDTQVHMQMQVQDPMQMQVQKGMQVHPHARTELQLQLQKQDKKDSDTSYQAQGDALPPQKIPIDVRGELWGEGVALLRGITGRAEGYARAFLGRLLKSSGDNAAAVLRALREAASLRPADPEGWLSAACRQPSGGAADDVAGGSLSRRKLAMLRAGGLTAADANGGLKCL